MRGGSPEGLLGQLDDVGGGLHVDVVVVECRRVSGGARLGQQDPQPAAQGLGGGRLGATGRGSGQEVPAVCLH